MPHLYREKKTGSNCANCPHPQRAFLLLSLNRCNAVPCAYLFWYRLCLFWYLRFETEKKFQFRKENKSVPNQEKRYAAVPRRDATKLRKREIKGRRTVRLKVKQTLCALCLHFYILVPFRLHLWCPFHIQGPTLTSQPGCLGVAQVTFWSGSRCAVLAFSRATPRNTLITDAVCSHAITMACCPPVEKSKTKYNVVVRRGSVTVK